MATTSNTIGINVSGIEKIKKAIVDYKSAIKKKSNIGAKRALIEKAIKGASSEAALRTYVANIDKSIENMLNDLNKYYNYLNTLADSYKKNDTGNTSFNVNLKNEGSPSSPAKS